MGTKEKGKENNGRENEKVTVIGEVDKTPKEGGRQGEKSRRRGKEGENGEMSKKEVKNRVNEGDEENIGSVCVCYSVAKERKTGKTRVIPGPEESSLFCTEPCLFG